MEEGGRNSAVLACGKDMQVNAPLIYGAIAPLFANPNRPTSMVVGSHHYVQLSEIDLSKTKISSGDLKSVKAITPSGAAVPSICR